MRHRSATRSSFNPSRNGRKTVRPRRGLPSETRQRLVAAAASLFNRVGYHGTDSNAIAHKAGYAAGTFYKHFQNKREIFLTAYKTWVTSEWKAIEKQLRADRKIEAVAKDLVAVSVEFHTKWRGLRASLLELVFTDREVRQFYREQRRRQLDRMAELRVAMGLQPRRREDDALHLFAVERTFDAIAQGEIDALGLNRKVVNEAMVKRVLQVLK